jgi:hypothetical protein
MFGVESDYRILAMMIAPALFMTATGSLIISSNNRLGRIVDRIRVLIDQADKIARPDNTLDFPELRLQALREEIDHLHTRNSRIRNAAALLYLAFALFVGASLAIAIDFVLKHQIANLPGILAVGGVGALLWASIYLFLETRTATNTVALEVDFHNRLHAERERAAKAKPATNRSETESSD